MAMMISKFNKIIHNKTVWLVFAVLISVAFVGVYTGQKASRDSTQKDPRKEVVGTLFGDKVTRLEFGRSYQNVYIMYCMMSGQVIKLTDEIDSAIRDTAWKRIAVLKKAEKMGLTSTPDQVVEYIQRQPIFLNQQTGVFDRNAYEAFVGGFLQSVGMGVKGFELMMTENVLMEKALAMAGQGALVTEDEIKEAFHLYSDLVTVEYAAIPRSLAKTPAADEAAAKAYYDRNPDEFRLPEKVIVRYVQFPISDYLNTVTVTDEMIASFYENNKQRYLKPAAEGAPADTAPEYRPLDEVADSIRELYITELARREAFNAADRLVARLADENTTFDQATEEAGLEIISNTPAFALTDSVRGVDPTAPFARAAFGLVKDATHYYSDPVVGREFTYVIALEKRLPSFLPAFEVVKADAIESARITAAEQLYIETAQVVHETIKADLENGKSFADAIAKHRMEPVTTEPFNVSSQLEDEFGREIAAATIRLNEGELSGLIPTSGDYLVAWVKSRETADEAATLPAMREELTQSLRNRKSAQLANAWQTALLEEAEFEDLTAGNES
ncbi:MAG TPA: SurA N-terminal domain-containing protein [Pontiella sp.]